MGLKSAILRVVAAQTRRRIERDAKRAIALQQSTFDKLIRKGRRTQFGKDHDFTAIHSHHDFAARIPIRDFEDLRP